MAARKRSKEQLIHDRARIAELKLQHYTDNEIKDILFGETGIQLSKRQISYDMGRIKNAWLTKQYENYDMLMARELNRIDVLEAEIWRAARDSARGKEKEVVDRARRQVKDSDDDEYEMVVTKVQVTLEGTAISPAYFDKIQECQKERRRLFGLYAPQGIDIRKQVIVVKGYAEVSPEDWPDAIEGEVIR